MRVVFFIPPLSRPSGGLFNIYGIAGALCGLGHDIAFICPGEAFGLQTAMDESGGRITLLDWPTNNTKHTTLTADDLFIIPESWPNAIALGVNAKARVVVYAQSWNFLLTTLPESVRWKSLPVSFIANSRPVAWFMKHILELDVDAIIPPAVNPVFFEAEKQRADSKKQPSANCNQAIRIAWLSRKNRGLAEQIKQVTEAALAREKIPNTVEWVEARNLSQPELAKVFSRCQLFLSVAFPEGFGLPPLEAMAAGVVPVGFTGFGGWEYMRQADIGETLETHAEWRGFQDICRPPFLLEGNSIPPNGFYFNDGDIMGAGLGVAHAVLLAVKHIGAFGALQENCRKTAEHYSEDNRLKRLEEIFSKLLHN